MSRKVLRVKVYRASPVGKQQVPDLCLTTALGHVPDPPDGTHYEVHHRLMHELVADRLVDALYQTLPGGTLDAVLVALLKRRASLFSVLF